MGGKTLSSSDSEKNDLTEEEPTPPGANPPSVPEVQSRQELPLSSMDRLAKRIDDLESNMNKLIEITRAIAEKNVAATDKPTGILGEFGQILEMFGGGGGSGDSDMMKNFYVEAHKSFDKVMISNLKKMAGLPEETPHMEVSH